MTKTHLELLEDFYQYWARRVQRGEVSPFDAVERDTLFVFAHWLDAREQGKEESDRDKSSVLA